ncbi:hypothetical protein LCGC14_1280840 [marine sediment metagenome]|uniref:Tll0287-like domain-containing protein n=1 Tax=marine sediment metagenome TaxID=412755 RepID=A0A0F9KWV1_9ZZZZ|nr:DUF3365 domain-containing protein [Candidatus Scalindua sediminis]HDY69073.1 DUF3365 domain-containing protein [Candidatus Scalindua sp.]
MPLQLKKNFKLFAVIVIVGAVVILSISSTNYQKQSAMLREEIFDKCEMIALELKFTREYLAETIALANLEHGEEARRLMPAMAGNEIGKKFYNATGYQLRQISSKYRNPDNKPDKFEEKALAEFEKDKNLSEYKGVDKINGQKVLRYLTPLYIEEACLKCHSAKETIPEFIQEDYPEDRATDYTFGDLRGAISVIVPVDRAEAEVKGHLIHMTIITTIGTIFLVTFIALAMNVSIRKIDRDKK